jgi:hypothetical protein
MCRRAFLTDLEKAGDFSKTLNSNGSKPTIHMPGTQYFGKTSP